MAADGRVGERRARRRQRSAPVAQAVVVRGLQKRFGRTHAVAGVDFDIPAGSFFGIVGPNGAGKTTTLKMATGLLRPDGGTIAVLGYDVWRQPLEAKRLMGVLPEKLLLFDRLTGSELLTYTGLLRSMPPETIEQRGRELLEVLGLSEAAGTLVSDFSQGMRKKIGLAVALLHAPRLLFLDEPLESVDPVSARTIRAVLRRFVESGGTVVFSSHVMETVERLCDHVAIFHQGRVLAVGPTAALCAGRNLEDVFIDVVGAAPESSSALAWLASSSD